MKLTLKPEWRLRPLSSFLGFIDLKTGVTVALLFALLNKVAGVYGLIAVLTGAGGSAAQLSLYIYSVLGLVALAWGLKAVNEEDPKRTLYFAHLFFADHVLSTAWTVFFAVTWWIYTPHDGRRVSNSPAQLALIDGYIGKHQDYTDAERALAAESIWGREKNQAATIIILGWLSKFYFAALLYSFAHHLRRNTYRSLPLSRSQPVPSSSSHPSNAAYSSLASAPLDGEDYELDDESSDAFYARGTHTPGTPLSSSIPIPGSSSQPQGRSKSHRTSLSLDKRRNGAGGSVGSFADFVSAPPPGRRAAGRTANGPQRGSLLANGNGHVGNGVNGVPGSSKSGSAASVSGSGSGGSVDGDVVFDSMRDEGDVGTSGRR